MEIHGAVSKTFIKERPSENDSNQKLPVTVDDAFEAVVEFENGAVGTLEASRFAGGRKNHNRFEINGSKGSLVFNLEDLNRLQVHYLDDGDTLTQGFRNVLVTEANHPFWNLWWSHGHIIGWEHTFVHELNHFLSAVVNNESVEPYGATFRDGYRNAVICDSILESAASGRRVAIEYAA